MILHPLHILRLIRAGVLDVRDYGEDFVYHAEALERKLEEHVKREEAWAREINPNNDQEKAA